MRGARVHTAGGFVRYEPEHIDPECCVVDISLCRGESWGKSEWVLGGVATQGGVVVAEAVVRPPGFSILVLTGKQQRAGAPTGPRARAVQRLGGVSLDDIGGLTVLVAFR